MKKRLLSFATAVSLVTLALAFASPVAHAAPPPCRVKDAQTGILFTTVQGAQDVATPGDKLVVKGTCIENVTFDRDLLVVGRPLGYGIPTIDGNATGSSVTVNAGVTFTIKALTITGGSGLTPFWGVPRSSLTSEAASSTTERSRSRAWSLLATSPPAPASITAAASSTTAAGARRSVSPSPRSRTTPPTSRAVGSPTIRHPEAPSRSTTAR